ncbi:MAG: hypothetical protein WCJ30_20795 [Deltaproteobacteria bacterium]
MGRDRFVVEQAGEAPWRLGAHSALPHGVLLEPDPDGVARFELE